MVTVVPLTKQESKKSRVSPLEAAFPAKLARNPVESIAMPYQIRCIAKARLLAPFGRVVVTAVRCSIKNRIIERRGFASDDPARDDEPRCDLFPHPRVL